MGLARSIRRLYDDPSLAQKLGQKAAAASVAFTWKNNAVRVLEKLRQVCETDEATWATECPKRKEQAIA
jgi:hypothetical protein